MDSTFIEVTGPGAALVELASWKKDWPLPAGRVLDQTIWEAQKQRALDLAETEGFLGAGFSEQVVAIDLENNTASLRLVLETGQQAVMGTISYEQDAVRSGILELLPRFREGQAYDAWLLEKFRLDLWRTGYFDNVELIEERRLEEVPPRVNLMVRAYRRLPNTYQGSLGLGTDTGIRAQVLWSRYLLSERGDHFNMGLGWQQKFNEYSFRSNYQVPRQATAREFHDPVHRSSSRMRRSKPSLMSRRKASGSSVGCQFPFVSVRKSPPTHAEPTVSRSRPARSVPMCRI